MDGGVATIDSRCEQDFHRVSMLSPVEMPSPIGLGVMLASADDCLGDDINPCGDDEHHGDSNANDRHGGVSRSCVDDHHGGVSLSYGDNHHGGVSRSCGDEHQQPNDALPSSSCVSSVDKYHLHNSEHGLHFVVDVLDYVQSSSHSDVEIVSSLGGPTFPTNSIVVASWSPALFTVLRELDPLQRPLVLVDGYSDETIKEFISLVYTGAILSSHDGGHGIDRLMNALGIVCNNDKFHLLQHPPPRPASPEQNHNSGHHHQQQRQQHEGVETKPTVTTRDKVSHPHEKSDRKEKRKGKRTDRTALKNIYQKNSLIEERNESSSLVKIEPTDIVRVAYDDDRSNDAFQDAFGDSFQDTFGDAGERETDRYSNDCSPENEKENNANERRTMGTVNGDGVGNTSKLRRLSLSAQKDSSDEAIHKVRRKSLAGVSSNNQTKPKLSRLEKKALKLAVKAKLKGSDANHTDEKPNINQDIPDHLKVFRTMGYRITRMSDATGAMTNGAHEMDAADGGDLTGNSSMQPGKQSADQNTTSSRGSATFVITCKVCDQTFSDDSLLQAHRSTCHQKGLNCSVCGKESSSVLALRKHMKLHSSSSLPSSSAAAEGGEAAECPVCRRNCKTKECLARHVLTHSDVKYECHQCNRSFRKEALLNKHECLKPSDRPYTCTECPKSFRNKYQLKAHMKFHTGGKVYQCDECFKQFPQLSTMKWHKKAHSKEKVYLCSICAKAFAHASTLAVHMKSHHTGATRYACEFCGYRTYHRTVLTKHIRCHTGEKPVVCEICGRGFRTKGQLNTHMFTHSDIKQFQCHICQKRFSIIKSLKDHIRTHTGERPFACPVCSKKFTSATLLSLHKRSHKNLIAASQAMHAVQSVAVFPSMSSNNHSADGQSINAADHATADIVIKEPQD